MKRSQLLDTSVRLGQPLNLLALPVLIVQGKRVRQRMPRLPAAQGPTEGASPGAEPPLYLTVLGDSAAAGVGASTHDEALAGYLGAEVARRTGRSTCWRVIARSGAKTADVARDLVPQLAGHIDVIIAVVGVNDLKNYRLIGDFRHDIRLLIEAIGGQAGPVPVVLAGIPPFQHMPGLPRPMRHILGLRGRAMNDVLRRLAAGYGQVRHVNLHDLQFPDNAFTDDGFHPSSRGYRLWAEILADEIDQTLRGGGE
jgi:lysophospholipase L1-like esterase